MDDKEIAVRPLDRDDLKRLFVLSIAEEVDPGLVGSNGPIFETDASLLDRELSPRARDAVSSRRPSPVDPFPVDPLILSDDNSWRFEGLGDLSQERARVYFSIGPAAEELVRATVRIEMEVLPGSGVLISLDHRSVLQLDPVHPHELRDLVGSEVEKGPPVGSQAARLATTELSVLALCHARDPAEEMRAGQDESGPIR